MEPNKPFRDQGTSDDCCVIVVPCSGRLEASFVSLMIQKAGSVSHVTIDYQRMSRYQ